MSFTSGMPEDHAFRTAPNSPMTAANDLGTLGGGRSEAISINASGQVVGDSNPAGTSQSHAFRTAPNGQITAASDLGGLSGWSNIYAQGINASGQAVGYALITASAVSHAFRTAPNAPIATDSDLGTLPGDNTGAVAWGINDSGQVVGISKNSIGNIVYSHAFRTAPNGSITAASALGTLGGLSSEAFAINASGQVVGDSTISSTSPYHAFRTTPNGTITAAGDLGTIGGGADSRAMAINSLGQTVGWSEVVNGGTPQHAFFVDTTGAMQDLNDLIAAGSGWILSDASGINDAGEIASSGVINGQSHAFLLVPVPEPGTTSVLAIAGLGTLRRRRRRPSSGRAPQRPDGEAGHGQRRD